MKEEYRRNLCQATHCSINFLILFISFNSAQNIQSEALEEDDFGKLGFQSIATLYFAVAIGCIFSTVVMKRIGEVKCMALGAFLNTPWIASYALCGISHATKPEDRRFYLQPDFIVGLILTLSFSNGLGQAVQWVGQGKYLSDCATENTKGFFYSYFWSFYMASQIFGNLIAAYCISFMSQQMLFLILALISFLSCILSLFLRKPTITEEVKVVEHDVIISERHFSNDLTTTSLLDLAPIVNTEQVEEQEKVKEQTMVEDIKSIWKMAKSKRMRLFLLQQFWTGVSIAYYSGTLTPMISDSIANQPDNVKLEKSMASMVAFGVGEVLGGLFIGYFIDTKGSKFVVVVNVIIMAVMTGVTLLYIGIYKFNAIAFFMTFMWGFQDGAINTHCFEMLGFEFENNYEPYSIFNFLQALGAAFFLLITSYVDDRTSFLVYGICIGLFGLLSCGITYFFDFHDPRSNSQINKSDGLHDKVVTHRKPNINHSVTTIDSQRLIEDVNSQITASVFRTEMDKRMEKDSESKSQLKFIEVDNDSQSSQKVVF